MLNQTYLSARDSDNHLTAVSASELQETLNHLLREVQTAVLSQGLKQVADLLELHIVNKTYRVSASEPPFCMPRMSLTALLRASPESVGLFKNVRSLAASADWPLRISLKYFRSDSTLARSLSLRFKAET